VLAWRPAVGPHRLELLDAAGKVLAISRFEVRGNREPAPDQKPGL